MLLELVLQIISDMVTYKKCYGIATLLTLSVNDMSHCRDVPAMSHCRDVFDMCHCRDVPDMSHCRDVPDTFQCRVVMH